MAVSDASKTQKKNDGKNVGRVSDCCKSERDGLLKCEKNAKNRVYRKKLRTEFHPMVMDI